MKIKKNNLQNLLTFLTKLLTRSFLCVKMVTKVSNDKPRDLDRGERRRKMKQLKRDRAKLIASRSLKSEVFSLHSSVSCAS